ncbi:16731_t:CDS:2, partial [Dentiscutata erythropus]
DKKKQSFLYHELQAGTAPLQDPFCAAHLFQSLFSIHLTSRFTNNIK